MSERLKKRKNNQGPNVSVRTDNSQRTNHLKPKFSLEYLQGDYCLSKCENHEKASFADALLKRSKMTWGEILQSARHALGSEKIDKKAINAPIPSHITEDTNIIALRFCGKAPMVGYRVGEVFYIIWLDRSFTLYKHE